MAVGDMHHMPEDLDTAVVLGIGWPANNLCRKMGEQMEGPTAEEHQKVGSHHADFGSCLMGPLSYDSVWSTTKGPINSKQVNCQSRMKSMSINHLAWIAESLQIKEDT
jgi:hypothetical protein